MYKKIFYFIFVVALVSYIPVQAQPDQMAQTEEGPIMLNQASDPCDEEPCRSVCAGADCGTSIACLECLAGTQVPIDGGIIWLLLAGAGYGVKKIVDHKKKQ